MRIKVLTAVKMLVLIFRVDTKVLEEQTASIFGPKVRLLESGQII
jgi:hypothetical protein